MTTKARAGGIKPATQTLFFERSLLSCHHFWSFFRGILGDISIFDVY
jgi:hypothetical protein